MRNELNWLGFNIITISNILSVQFPCVIIFIIYKDFETLRGPKRACLYISL